MVSRILSVGFVTVVSAALLASAGTVDTSARDLTTLEERTSTADPVLIGCYPGGAGGCPCPKDLNGDKGVLINFFPGYQCAYPGGACSWDDQVSSLPLTVYMSLTDCLWLNRMAPS